MPYATATDVEDRFIRPLDENESRVVGTRLADAELLIRSRIPDLDTKVTDGELSEDIVVMVEADAVLRLIRNPDGYTEEADGNYSYSISEKVASGRLDILPHEWSLLGKRGGVFVVAPMPRMPWEGNAG